MLNDPLLVYAARDAPVPPELLNIFRLQQKNGSEPTAYQAYAACREAALKGSPLAMCICSRLSRSGWGTPPSNEDAFDWAQRAASAGFPPGHYEVGRCYEEGIGIPKDVDKARQRYEMAAEGGFGFAACHLAEMYHAAQFGSKDMINALKYSKLAYELREPMAPYLIATWYEEGDGVIKNNQESVLWYTRAAELGNYFASFRLSRAYSLGQLGLAKDRQMAKKYEEMCASSLPPTPPMP